MANQIAKWATRKLYIRHITINHQKMLKNHSKLILGEHKSSIVFKMGTIKFSILSANSLWTHFFCRHQAEKEVISELFCLLRHQKVEAYWVNEQRIYPWNTSRRIWICLWCLNSRRQKWLKRIVVWALRAIVAPKMKSQRKKSKDLVKGKKWLGRNLRTNWTNC